MIRHAALSAALLSFLLAGAASAAGQAGELPAPADHPAAKIVHRLAHVAASNSDWLRTGVRVEPGDVVVLSASGTVKTSEISGDVGPGGFPSGDGRLEAQIGSGKPMHVGASAAIFPAEAGLLKLRVHDKKYIDNAGGFEVRILRIPAALVPKPDPVREDEE